MIKRFNSVQSKDGEPIFLEEIHFEDSLVPRPLCAKSGSGVLSDFSYRMVQILSPN